MQLADNPANQIRQRPLGPATTAGTQPAPTLEEEGGKKSGSLCRSSAHSCSINFACFRPCHQRLPSPRSKKEKKKPCQLPVPLADVSTSWLRKSATLLRLSGPHFEYILFQKGS